MKIVSHIRPTIGEASHEFQSRLKSELVCLFLISACRAAHCHNPLTWDRCQTDNHRSEKQTLFPALRVTRIIWQHCVKDKRILGLVMRLFDIIGLLHCVLQIIGSALHDEWFAGSCHSRQGCVGTVLPTVCL